MVLLGDFNAHSPEWNVHYGEKREAVGVEKFVGAYNIILNNEPEKALPPTRRKMTSIIDLTFTTPDIGAPNMWVIDD